VRCGARSPTVTSSPGPAPPSRGFALRILSNTTRSVTCYPECAKQSPQNTSPPHPSRRRRDLGPAIRAAPQSRRRGLTESEPRRRSNEVTQRRRLRPPPRPTAQGRVAEAVVFGGRVLSLGETDRDRGDDEWLVRREIGETSRLVRLNELPGRLVSPMAPDTRAVDTGGSQMNRTGAFRYVLSRLAEVATDLKARGQRRASRAEAGPRRPEAAPEREPADVTAAPAWVSSGSPGSW